jgi:hypothetical protein
MEKNMQLKITKSKGRTVDVEPGVTMRITGIDSADMRNEVSKILAKQVPRIVNETLGEQLELVVQDEDGKKEDD